MLGRGDRAGGGRDIWAVDGFAPLPGDIMQFPNAARGTVQTVYLCAESNGVDLIRWSWIVLDDGRLLEIAPRGCALYDPPTTLVRGNGPFLELAAQDGALVRFEERVRAGDWQKRPVRLSLGGRRWRISSTGTLTARRLGPVPESVWGQLRTERPQASTAAEAWSGAGIEPAAEDRDVYFTLLGQAGKQPERDALGLGVWMTDIGLAFGRRLGDSPDAAGISVISGED